MWNVQSNSFPKKIKKKAIWSLAKYQQVFRTISDNGHLIRLLLPPLIFGKDGSCQMMGPLSKLYPTKSIYVCMLMLEVDTFQKYYFGNIQSSYIKQFDKWPSINYVSKILPIFYPLPSVNKGRVNFLHCSQGEQTAHSPADLPNEIT